MRIWATPRIWVAALFALMVLPALAAVEIGGIKFDDTAKVGTEELSFNGGGIRTRLVFQGYSMALYLAQKKTSADGVLGLAGAKRVHIVTLRKLGADQFADALVDGIQKNSTEAEVAKMQARIDQFKATLLGLKEAPSGTTILLDYLPDSGTRLVVNGEPRGKDIAGEDFYRAVLRIWIGDKPVQQDLKNALLGKSS